MRILRVAAAWTWTAALAAVWWLFVRHGVSAGGVAAAASVLLLLVVTSFVLAAASITREAIGGARVVGAVPPAMIRTMSRLAILIDLVRLIRDRKTYWMLYGDRGRPRGAAHRVRRELEPRAVHLSAFLTRAPAPCCVAVSFRHKD